jgi:c-di-GMP-binding flagellar brake protein YcgR
VIATSWIQRRFTRYPIVFPILFTQKTSAPSSPGAGWTCDLSGAGACVELAEPLPAQAELQVRIQTDRGPFEVDAQVVWAGERPPADRGIRHGLAFTQLSRDQRRALRSLLLAKRRETRRAGVRLPFEAAVTSQSKGEAGPLLQGQTRDVSRGGLLLRLPKIVPPDTTLDLTLHTRPGPLTAEGAVVWRERLGGQAAGPPFRHGFRFTTLRWSTSLSLGLFLAEAA